MTNKEFKSNINLENPIEVEELIRNTESGMYGSKNDSGNEVTVYMQQGEGMDLHVNQDNGWIRVDEYSVEGLKISESFAGRWNK